MSNLEPIGTKLSGLSNEGPFHCEDCVHRKGSYCMHPIVMNDPEAKKSREKQPSTGYIKIDLERDCCAFVRPPKDHKVPGVLRRK